jgi:biopolymer transport protein ExbD
MKVPTSYPGTKKSRIEMLPLIDIVFLLLVFFIYAMLSMAVHRSLPLTLPVSTAVEVDTELDLMVSVQEGGRIFLNETRITLEELQEMLHNKVKRAENSQSVQVDLFADRAITYQELYRVLDSIRSAGVANVSLQADSKY